MLSFVKVEITLMKKLKKFIQNRILINLTPAVKLIVLINIGVALFCYLFELITGYELQYLISIYPTYSEHFHFYQLFTFLFVHSTNPTHIIFNVLFLLLFAPFFERKFGFRKFIVGYFICAWIGFIFTNYSYYSDKEIVEKRISATGINPKTIPLNEMHEVDRIYFSQLNDKQQIAVEEYNNVTSKTNGASGALFGFTVFYLFLNILNYRKIIFIALGFHLLYGNLEAFLQPSSLMNGSCFAHFGGMIGGFLFVCYYWITKMKKNDNVLNSLR
jgi:membrane associated rhomboid family serine protease